MMNYLSRARTWATAALLITALVATLGFGASAANAAQVRVYQGAYSSGIGGEFNLDGVGGELPLTSAVTPSSHDFATFCAQVSQTFSAGELYNYTLSTQTNHRPPYYALNNATAWLFHGWNMALLSDYDYTNAGSSRTADADQMQLALWALLGEISAPGSGKAKVWYEQAMAIANPLGQDNLGRVRIMNLYSQYRTDAQDMFAEVPVPSVPEPAGVAMLLLGCCTALPLPLLRRRRARS